MIDAPSEWTVKKLVRARDGNACKECGIFNDECQTIYGRGLHVHRIVPGSEYTLDGCVLLCKRCHNLAHGHQKLTVPEGGFPPPSPTQARQFRLSDEIVAMLDVLAAKWGGTLKPLSHTEVIREAIRRAHHAECQKKS